jgi:hypothetical protein
MNQLLIAMLGSSAAGVTLLCVDEDVACIEKYAAVVTRRSRLVFGHVKLQKVIYWE